MKINWDNIVVDTLVGYENDDFLIDLPTYIEVKK